MESLIVKKDEPKFGVATKTFSIQVTGASATEVQSLVTAHTNQVVDGNTFSFVTSDTNTLRLAVLAILRLSNQNKIEGIKFVREATGLGLSDAKVYVEQYTSTFQKPYTTYRD